MCLGGCCCCEDITDHTYKTKQNYNYNYKYTIMSQQYTASQYDRLLGEGQNCSDYVDQHGRDLSKQPKGTLSESEARHLGSTRRYQTGEGPTGVSSSQGTSHTGMAVHGVDDYNKILGEGQDDYKEGEYEELLHRQAQRNQEPKMQQPPPHHYVSNNFQPEKQLQARNMDEQHIPTMNTTCPEFEGKGHHTPVPGAGQMRQHPDYQHSNEFHLVGSGAGGAGTGMDQPEQNPSSEQAIPRIMKQQQEARTMKPEAQHQGVFARLKKTVSR